MTPKTPSQDITNNTTVKENKKLLAPRRHDLNILPIQAGSQEVFLPRLPAKVATRTEYFIEPQSTTCSNLIQENAFPLSL